MITMKHWKIVLCKLWICLIVVISSFNVQAEIDHFNQDGQFILLGKAVKKFLTFRVVSVDLFIAPNHTASQILDEIPKSIHVTYHVNIPKPELDRATLKGIEQNVSAEELTRIMPAIEQINSYYPDVKSGDQIVITYIPGRGCEVKVKGEVKGIVPGDEFARAFFAIWVGEHPVDERAKAQLLGKNRGERKDES